MKWDDFEKIINALLEHLQRRADLCADALDRDRYIHSINLINAWVVEVHASEELMDELGL